MPSLKFFYEFRKATWNNLLRWFYYLSRIMKSVKQFSKCQISDFHLLLHASAWLRVLYILIMSRQTLAILSHSWVHKIWNFYIMESRLNKLRAFDLITGIGRLETERTICSPQISLEITSFKFGSCQFRCFTNNTMNINGFAFLWMDFYQT